MTNPTDDLLRSIESRWLAASPGPWTVVDVRSDRPPERITYADAIDRGLVANQEEYIKLLDSAEEAGLNYETVSENCRMVIPAPKRMVRAEQRETDRALAGLVPRIDETPPCFAVLDAAQDGRCSEADLTFVTCASSDVGTLLQIVRTLQRDRQRMKDGLCAILGVTSDPKVLAHARVALRGGS